MPMTHPVARPDRFHPGYWLLPVVLVGASTLAEDLAGGPAGDAGELPPMIVTATRRAEMTLELPFSALQIDSVRLRSEQMATSVPEALLETHGVMVQQTARGQGSPFLRGFTGFRTVALVDGIRLNNSTFREGPNQYWSTIDILAVDELEVVRGPGSVMYGSDAIGGVVNAIMRSPGPGNGPSTQWTGMTAYRFGSAERAHLGRAEGGGVQEGKWGFHVGGSIKDYGDVEGGRDVGRQPGTGFTQWDLDAKVRYDLSPQTQLVVAHQTTEQDGVSRTHNTVQGIRWEGLSAGTNLRRFYDQQRHLTYARLLHETEGDHHFTATVSWHVQNEIEYIQAGNGSWRELDMDVDTLGISLQGVSPSSIGTWTYGTEYYRDLVDTEGRRYDAAYRYLRSDVQGNVGDDASHDNLGVYAEDAIPLAERLKLTLGGRVNWSRADIGRMTHPTTGLATSFEDDWTQVVGSGRVRWFPTPDEDWSLFAGASQGFRAPNLSDVSSGFQAQTGVQEIAALNLEPEKFITVEGGAKIARRTWEAEAAYYHTFIDDLIVRAPTGVITPGGLTEVTKLNASSGWLHGVELSGRVFVGGGVSVFARGAWQEGEGDAYASVTTPQIRAPLSRMHPATGILGVRWDSEKKDIFAEVFGMASDQQDRLSPDDTRDTSRIPPGGTPGWATLNLRAGYTWKERLRGVVGLENVTDEDYRIHGSGFNQPGRNLKLSVEYRF